MALLGRIASAFKGFAWILRGNPRAVECYDFSERGFWQSFYASLLALVVFSLVSQPIGDAADIWGDHPFGFALKQFTAGLLGWFPSLTILWLIAKLCRSADRYSAFIVLFNWSQVVVLLLIIVVRLAHGFGWVNASVLGWLDLIAIVVVFIFVFRAARLALGISMLGALGMSIADLVISKMLAHLIHGYAVVLL